MTSERWQRARQILHEALEREPGERGRFLAEACSGDESLRQEVEALVMAHEQAGRFLEAPVVKGGGLHADVRLIAGTKLGLYEVGELIGAGGMGEVYEATDSKLGRSVAIKFLPPAFAQDAERIARFEREARVLASLNHPNIAAIYGLEESGGERFLVMELVPGETLAEKIKRDAIPVKETLRIAAQIAEALEAAHERGVVHRDLKPANINVTPDGKVKVLDFGLAKAFTGDRATEDTSNSPTLSTVPGLIMGTAAYLSPEQARGKVVNQAGDIWAFGCVLYELLTGRQAFPGEDITDILAAVMRAEPDWSRLPEATPPTIRTLLQRCLRKDRRQRLQDATSVRIEIEDVLSGAVSTQPAATRVGRRERFVAILAILALLAAALMLGISYFRTPARMPEMRVEITTPMTSDPRSFAISPDGRKLAFVAADAGKVRLWLRSLDATKAQPLDGTEGATYPFWSPNSNALGFFADGKLKRLDIDGGLPQTVAIAPGGRGGTWNPDGMILFATADATGSLSIVPSSGAGEVVRVTKVDSPSEVSHRFPQFLPDGRKFLFFVQGPPEKQGIYLGELNSSQIQRLTAADVAGVYMPPGWLLFLRQGTLVARRFDPARGELTGDPITVAGPVGFDASLGAGAFSASGTGIVAYRSSGVGRRQLMWFDRSGKPVGTLGEPDENGLVAPSLSPDGRRVAAHRTMQNNTDIWIFDADHTTRVTFDAGRDMFPIWSPDGEYLAFDSNRKGPRYFYQKRSDVAGAEIPLLESPEDKVLNDWSPDGRFLLYVTPNTPKTGADMWYLPLFGNRKPVPFLKTDFLERAGKFSPDGRWVAYHSNESGPYEIYIRSFPGPGGPWQVSTSGGIQARWSVDGKELYYIAPDGELMAASIKVTGAAIEPGRPVALFQTRIWGGGTNATQGQQYDVARDGRFIMNITADVAPPITLILNWQPKP
jgi:eukaryotic-like serine/threonine-protein kinase